MKTWNICTADTDECIGKVAAKSDLDALNTFARQAGYAGYDIDAEDENKPYRLPNGRLIAPFENFEVVVY